jgi:hypothetical protein
VAGIRTAFGAAIRWISLLFSLMLALYVINRVWVTNSEPYAFAERFLLGNPCLRREVGLVQSMKMPYFEPYRMGNGAIKGNATFTVSVRGKLSNANIRLTLVKALGEWSVVSAIVKNESSTSSSDDLTQCR